MSNVNQKNIEIEDNIQGIPNPENNMPPQSDLPDNTGEINKQTVPFPPIGATYSYSNFGQAPQPPKKPGQ